MLMWNATALASPCGLTTNPANPPPGNAAVTSGGVGTVAAAPIVRGTAVAIVGVVIKLPRKVPWLTP